MSVNMLLPVAGAGPKYLCPGRAPKPRNNSRLSSFQEATSAAKPHHCTPTRNSCTPADIWCPECKETSSKGPGRGSLADCEALKVETLHQVSKATNLI